MSPHTLIAFLYIQFPPLGIKTTELRKPHSKQRPNHLRTPTMATSADGGAGENTDCTAVFFDSGSVESSRYFHCRRTIFEMLRDRGYAVPDSELTLSLDEFRSLFGQQPNPDSLRICVYLRFDPSKTVLVLFMGTSDIINKQTIKSMYNQIEEKERSNGLIVIVQSKMTPYARKELLNCPCKVEIIEMNDLLVNIAKHVLQPKYEVLTVGEKQELLAKYKLEEKQLPHMLKSDAIARYYGLEKGQVVKVTHSGPLVDYVVTFRCVV